MPLLMLVLLLLLLLVFVSCFSGQTPLHTVPGQDLGNLCQAHGCEVALVAVPKDLLENWIYALVLKGLVAGGVALVTHPQNHVEHQVDRGSVHVEGGGQAHVPFPVVK